MGISELRKLNTDELINLLDDSEKKLYELECEIQVIKRYFVDRKEEEIAEEYNKERDKAVINRHNSLKQRVTEERTKGQEPIKADIIALILDDSEDYKDDLTEYVTKLRSLFCRL